MDRIRQLWIDSSTDQNNRLLYTSHTYDDDDIFRITTLQILGKCETLGNPRHALQAILVTTKQRASFLDGLSVRITQFNHNKSRNKQHHHHDNESACLVQAMEPLRRDLIAMVHADSIQEGKPEAPTRERKGARRFFPETGAGELLFRKRGRVADAAELCVAVEQMRLEQQQQQGHHQQHHM